MICRLVRSLKHPETLMLGALLGLGMAVFLIFITVLAAIALGWFT